MISGRDERTWIASVEHHASRLGRMRGSTHRRYTHTAPRTGGNRRTAQIVRRNIPASYEYPDVWSRVTKLASSATAPIGPRRRSNNSATRTTSPWEGFTTRTSSASNHHAPGTSDVSRPARNKRRSEERRVGKER